MVSNGKHTTQTKKVYWLVYREVVNVTSLIKLSSISAEGKTKPQNYWLFLFLSGNPETF